MAINIEKLKYLLSFMEEYICDSIDEVLNDSQQDPQFSAVAVSNMIHCYLDIVCEIGGKLPYDTVDEFLKFNGYTEEECSAFELSRQHESEYYRGVQY